MLLYRVSATALALETAAGADTLVQRLSESFRFAFGAAASASECRAWARSLPVLAQDLSSAGLGQVEVLIEYQLPQTSKRADVVLCGTHPRSGRPSFVVVELKQWTQASATDSTPWTKCADTRSTCATLSGLWMPTRASWRERPISTT